jgi:DNA-binding response OmpR family regulator
MNNNPRILIADPDERVLIDLERVLQDAGFDTTTAWSSKQMQDLIGERRFDLLLVADHPPEINCETILRQTRQGGWGTPVIVLEGKQRHPFAEPYLLTLGAHEIVHKWDTWKVRDAVHQLFNASCGKPAKSAVAAALKVG